uniref:Uncharacterized protein n=1 Tax=Pristionchus pacificus TaxID=54126 RepID=A0A2A6CUL6_PRIPA|eukprot:PDM81875.1 hypothetical protein PRIPAC_34029 [Pristionchus pacificus]
MPCLVELAATEQRNISLKNLPNVQKTPKIFKKQLRSTPLKKMPSMS